MNNQMSDTVDFNLQLFIFSVILVIDYPCETGPASPALTEKDI